MGGTGEREVERCSLRERSGSSVVDGVEAGEGGEVEGGAGFGGGVALGVDRVGEALAHRGGHAAVEERLVDGVDEGVGCRRRIVLTALPTNSSIASHSEASVMLPPCSFAMFSRPTRLVKAMCSPAG